jgi:hypothetical protein
VLPVEGSVPAAPAEGVGLGVSLTVSEDGLISGRFWRELERRTQRTKYLHGKKRDVVRKERFQSGYRKKHTFRLKKRSAAQRGEDTSSQHSTF